MHSVLLLAYTMDNKGAYALFLNMTGTPTAARPETPILQRARTVWCNTAIRANSSSPVVVRHYFLSTLEATSFHICR